MKRALDLTVTSAVDLDAVAVGLINAGAISLVVLAIGAAIIWLVVKGWEARDNASGAAEVQSFFDEQSRSRSRRRR